MRHALYIEMEKAYDSVEFWQIEEALHHHGFPPRFVAIVMSNSASLLLPTSQTEFYPVTHGVRQGDPLSPYLFLLVLNPLLCHLDQTVRGYSLSNEPNAQAITYLAYADDLIFSSNSYAKMQSMVDLVEHFCTHNKFRIKASKSAYSE